MAETLKGQCAREPDTDGPDMTDADEQAANDRYNFIDKQERHIYSMFHFFYNNVLRSCIKSVKIHRLTYQS